MNGKKTNFILLTLIAGTALAMIAVIPVDYDWTLFLRAHCIKGLTKFMDRSMFEGKALGGGDPVIFILILVMAGYFLAWKPKPDSRLQMWRPQLGFILTGGLTSCLIMVQSLKWAWGRARPNAVYKGHLPFTEWFEFGPQFITDGIYSGSFPSGHTAQAFSLMAIAYALMSAPVRRKALGRLGIAWGVACLVFAVTMAITRCMNASHWVSDTLASVGLGWIVLHLLYHRTFQVPMQNDYYRKQGRHPDHPHMWELRIYLYILGTALGATAVILGLRAVVLDVSRMLWLLIPTGVACLIFFPVRIVRLRQIVFRAYG